MNRRGFFGTVGGGAIGIALAKLGWKKPPSHQPSEDVGRLVVTAFFSEPELPYGGSCTWVISDPKPGILRGPKMKFCGTVTKLSVYAEKHDYTGQVDVYRVFNPGDTLDLVMT